MWSLQLLGLLLHVPTQRQKQNPNITPYCPRSQIVTGLIIGVNDKTQRSTGNIQRVTPSNPISAVNGVVGKDGTTSADRIQLSNEKHWKLTVFLQYHGGEN